MKALLCKRREAKDESFFYLNFTTVQQFILFTQKKNVIEVTDDSNITIINISFLKFIILYSPDYRVCSSSIAIIHFNINRIAFINIYMQRSKLRFIKIIKCVFWYNHGDTIFNNFYIRYYSFR